MTRAFDFEFKKHRSSDKIGRQREGVIPSLRGISYFVMVYEGGLCYASIEILKAWTLAGVYPESVGGARAKEITL